MGMLGLGALLYAPRNLHDHPTPRFFELDLNPPPFNPKTTLSDHMTCVSQAQTPIYLHDASSCLHQGFAPDCLHQLYASTVCTRMS
jgi:hypothetical protein